MLKKIIFTAILALVCTTNVWADKKIQVTINDETVSFDKAPIIIQDRTMVPLRGLFEELGYNINWLADKKTAIISNTETSIEISPYNYTYIVNNEEKNCDVPAQLIEDSLYLPLRTIVESTDLSISWDNETKTVSIYTSNSRSLALQNANQYLEGYSKIIEPIEEKSHIFDNITLNNSEINADFMTEVVDYKQMLEAAYTEVRVLKTSGTLDDIKKLHLQCIERYVEFCDIIIAYNNNEFNEDTLKKEIKYINSEILLLENKIVNAFSKL